MSSHSSRWEAANAQSFESILSQPRLLRQGKVGEGNIGVHSGKERRYVCHTCGKTFSVSKGTPFYRLHKAADLMVIVVTLLCHGCPVQAIVAAFGLDERTVATGKPEGASIASGSTSTSFSRGRWPPVTSRPMSRT